MAEVKKILSMKYKVETIEEARVKNPFDSDKKSSFVSQFFIVSSQINAENKKSLTAPDFLLCDQSVLDQWIAWRHYNTTIENSPQMTEKDEVIRTLYRFWIKTYELIFLIRTDLKELEKRGLDNELRIAAIDRIKPIEELYKETIREDKIKVVEIWNNSTIDESAHEILKHISEFSGPVLDKDKVKENGNANANIYENGPENHQENRNDYGNQTGGV